MNKEAEKLLEEAIAYKGDYAYDFMCKKINQALLSEQPNCEGCEHFKHTNKDEHCYRYTEEPSLCKLRQEPVEFFPLTCKDMYKVIQGCCGLCPWCVGVLGRYVKQESTRLESSEASRKELLAACETAEKELDQRYKAQEGSAIDKLALKIVRAAIKSSKEISEKK